MAHVVQAGDARPAKRSALVVLLLGFITGGIYTVYWWYRANRDLQQFESTGGRRSAAAPVLDTVLAVVAWILMTWMRVLDAQQSRPPAPATPGSPPVGAAAPVEQAGAASPTAILVLFGGALVIYIALAVRLRRNVVRATNLAGLLPEERQSPVLWFLCAALGPIIASAAAQDSLNNIWDRYPRWFKSIGGTREELDAAEAEPAASAGPAFMQPAAAPAPALAPVAVAAPAPVSRAEQLAAKAADGSITAAEAFEYARTIEQAHGADHAAPWYRYTTQADPANKDAAYWYGCYALDRGEESAIALLHTVLGDPRFDAFARSRIVAWLLANGRTDEAARYGPVATQQAA